MKIVDEGSERLTNLGTGATARLSYDEIIRLLCLYKVGENTNGAPKMRNNYGAIQLLIFVKLSFKFIFFFISLFIVIPLPTIVRTIVVALSCS